ncbi:diguanylate cyclase [Rhizobium sp. FY34]|uniref:GGDEF domain-containing response regulator n=1 Tax=Rhizobium sp. FY34 TaxID=2562309 RepID=UPI001FEDD224|nr:diguanylate cyclase [Rhizobium sp. FY34]
MSKFRQSQTAPALDKLPAKIMIIEASVSLAMLMRNRIETETGAHVVVCGNLSGARKALERERFTMALTGHRLPDAPDGEILDLLAEFEVPTVLFSGSVIDELQTNYARYRLVDYITKDNRNTVEIAVAAVAKVIANQTISVLVVDDAKAARNDLVDFLLRQNYKVVEAKTGHEALQRLAEDPSIAMVITDYYMPDMDGYELTKAIRATYSSERLRIIGVSASTDRRLSALFLKAGASDFLYRPFVPEELQCRVNNTVETLMQLKRLRHLAERDPLTGLFNRRAFFERADKQLARLNAAATGTGAIAILDIDHFKQINDNFGHDSGDIVLKQIASILHDHARQEDYLLARLGGEEFVLLFPDRTLQESQSLCEAILRGIRAADIMMGESSIRVTGSIGLSMLNQNEPLNNQLHAADQMLYLAKSAGRDQLCSDASFQ